MCCAHTSIPLPLDRTIGMSPTRSRDTWPREGEAIVRTAGPARFRLGLTESYAKLQRLRGAYEAPGATSAGYELGLQTRIVAYERVVRLLRARGGRVSQRTTNGQRAAGMAAAGRPRCERMMQRVHRDLEAMGVLRVRHVRKSGAARRRGELDCLRLCSAPIGVVALRSCRGVARRCCNLHQFVRRC